jgi:hypothetical protein
MSDAIDHNYLRIQFWLKIHEKSGSEFQSFFESIALKAISGFQKVRPYGNQGDGGNDGYIPSEGTYYQAYAPSSPQEKEAEAAKKMKDDFAKLQNSGWDQISNIKKYRFIFNDKGNGVSIEIEKAIAELRSANSSVEFAVLLPKDLESLFFGLNQNDILSLGFDINTTKAVSIAHDLLNKLEVDIDRDNGRNVLKQLENIAAIISELNDDGLTLLYELLEARAMQKVERFVEAKSKFESLVTRYPRDPRATLYLAEHYLNNEDFDKNKELLEQAEKIDSTHWLFALESLIRIYRMEENIDVSKVDENSFPSDPRIKSNFYRLHAFFYDRANDYLMSDSFIAKAIHCNPEKFNNYNAKISLLIARAHREKDQDVVVQQMKSILKEFEVLEEKVLEWGGLSDRNRAVLNVKKMHICFVLDEASEIERLAPETFELLKSCYFDPIIDELIVEFLLPISLPDKDFGRLLEYLKQADNTYSDDLGNVLLVQFLYRGNLFTDGLAFFTETKHQTLVDLVNNIQTGQHDAVLTYLKDHVRFAVGLANTAKDFPELRKKIIEALPSDGSIQKEKLLLLLNYDQKQTDEAFELIQKMDLTDLGYYECRPILQIAKDKQAWDFVIVILQRLMSFEKDKHASLQLKLDLFNAYLHLEKYPELIALGEAILDDSSNRPLLKDDQGWEWLIAQTSNAYLKRGENKLARDLIEKNKASSKTFEYKAFAEVPVYLKNSDAQKALESIIEAVKTLKHPSPEQYGRLFLWFTEIGNLIDYNANSSEKVSDGDFVKVKEDDRWFYIGDEEELDATKIPKDDQRYSQFIDKKTGDKVFFEDKYRSSSPEYIIESILPIGKYILWQCMHHAQKLSLEKRWDLMESIEVPMTGEESDLRFVIARLEDERKKRADFFEMYCKNNLPLAMLAVNEGGLTNALGAIINENRGYVKFSTGELSEINQQKKVAEGMIKGDVFYIDGTSALILSETGLLEHIYKHLPHIKVPQSVISLLLETKDRFAYRSGQVGSLGFAQGKLKYSTIDKETREKIEGNFDRCIKLLESRPADIGVISQANKHSGFTEQRTPEELCDACILSQKEGVGVLTEDLFYLKANELETKKKISNYSSSFALVRVLYEQKKVSLDQYLNFFSYLASYRFRFLPLSTDDITNAVFGDGALINIQPEKIRQLHFGLTMSEEYGVSFDTAFLVVGRFIVKILNDDAISPETTEKIFSEILTAFPVPKNMDSKMLGRMFLRAGAQTINNLRQRIIVGTRSQEKLDRLSQLIELFGGKNLIIP